MAVFNKEFFSYTCNHNNHITLIFSHPGLDRMWMFHDISQSPHDLIELECCLNMNMPYSSIFYGLQDDYTHIMGRLYGTDWWFERRVQHMIADMMNLLHQRM